MAALSRREFAHILGGAAAAAALPLPLLARSPVLSSVRLSANENPYGPSAVALQAIRDSFPLICRYPDDEVDALIDEIAKLHGVSPKQVLLGDGSSEILQLAASAFSNAQRPLVVAEPTFESIAQHAQAGGAEVKRIPLDATYAHDLPKMLDASRGAGLVYVCNPNNPTATITPDKTLRSFIGAASPDTTILVDEAYYHYATSSEYGSVIDLAAKQPNLIASRTFSKIYGMAGLRCGYCVAQEQTIRRLATHQAWDTVNVMALVAARASLTDARHVPEYRRRNSDTKSWLRQNVERLGYRMLPSEANFVMIDMKQDVKPLITAMRGRGVRVGRLFPAMPRHMRVTIGRPEEMQRFVEELAKVT
ncbi:MAG TPA: aminotransferase class I/II-fold pyridoxal phosphate-dependent enzyme [Thermoanaerobaculia bacterium]